MSNSGVVFRLSDLPEPHRAKVALILGAVVPAQGVALHIPIPAKIGRQPTKAELEFRDKFLVGLAARFEGLRLKVAGHWYTPDWVTIEGGQVVCYEVKGSYRMHSYGRSRLAFDAAREAWPWFRFVWAQKNKDGEWRVK